MRVLRHPEEDPVVLPWARDISDRVIEHRLAQEQRRDRRGERDEIEHAEGTRPLLVRKHPVDPTP